MNIKKFEIGKVYTDVSYYDGYTSIYKMKVINRTAKTLTAEITMPSGKTETAKMRIYSPFNSESVKFNNWKIFSADIQ